MFHIQAGKELFEKVLIRIEEEFDIPFVWISVINRPHLTDMIRFLRTSKILKDRINIIDETTFFSLIADGAKPVLANDGLNPFFKLLPRKKKYFNNKFLLGQSIHKKIITI